MNSIIGLVCCIALIVEMIWSPRVDFIDRVPAIWYNGLDSRKNRVRVYFKFW